MPHAYRPYCANFSYVGRYKYFLTWVTHERSPIFQSAAVVALVWAQILRAAVEQQFAIVAYCFMPDHVHLIVAGTSDESDLKAFVKLAKQYAGYHFARAHPNAKAWQRGTHDHIVRDDVDLLDRLRYVVNNPVVAGLVKKAEDYPFLGSQVMSLDELLEKCKPRH